MLADGFEELYELEQDPWELDNLAFLEPGHPMLPQLRESLQDLRP